MFERFRKIILFLVGFTIPLQGLSLGSGALATTPFKIMTVPLLMLAGFEYGMRSGNSPHDRKAMWVLMFAASYGVSSAMAAVGGVPLRVLVGPGSTMAALSAFYYLLWYSSRTREHLTSLIWGIAIGGALTMAPTARTLRQGAFVDATDRAAGLAGQSNVLGADMVVCFALAAGLFFTAPKLLRRLFAAGTGVAAVVGLVVSLSRSAFVGFGAMALLWLVRAGRQNVVKYVTPAILLAMVGVSTLPQAAVDRFGTIFDARAREEDDSIQSRFATYWVAVEAFGSNPAIGVGAERFRLWAIQNGYGKLHTIHNGYLYITAEQGLLGIIPFIGLLVLTWRDYSIAWRSARRHRRLRDPSLYEIGELALFLQMALLSLAVGAAFHQMHKSKALWTLMALSPLVRSLVQERIVALRGDAPEGAKADALPAPGPSWEASRYP